MTIRPRTYKCRSLTGFVEEDGGPYTLSLVLELAEGKTLPAKIQIGSAQVALFAEDLTRYLAEEIRRRS